MLSLRDLARTYLDYYKSGGVKYSLQNDAAILRAIESILQKQFETPQVLLSHIEAALAQQTRDLKESVEWGRSVEQLKEALSKVEDLRQQIGQLQRPSRLDELRGSSNAPATRNCSCSDTWRPTWRAMLPSMWAPIPEIPRKPCWMPDSACSPSSRIRLVTKSWSSASRK